LKGRIEVKNYIRKRAVMVGRLVSTTSITTREAAEYFNISSATVYKDLVERLPKINKALADDVRKVLDRNKAESHIRGGEATKRKYEK
jgi:putative DeoR family transcriptional regulator (stage III sporulation protein D)